MDEITLHPDVPKTPYDSRKQRPVVIAVDSQARPARPLCFWCLAPTMVPVNVLKGRLMSTGEVARLLGVSRQHVVDLCTQGRLPFITVGTHRRVREADVEELLRGGELTREAERSLWLHRAVAGKVVLDPDTALETAGRNLATMRLTHPDGMSAAWLDRWQAVLARGLDATLDALTSRSAEAIELRQNSPFAGVLTEDERTAVHRSFRAHWRREHTAA